MPKIRVGIPETLHCRPLAWGFLKGEHSSLFVAGEHPQASLVNLLAQGVLDVALLPVADLPRVPDVRIVPELALGAGGEGSYTAFLLSRLPWGSAVPFEGSQRPTLAVDLNARTEVALAQVLFRERFRLEPQVMAMRPNLERMVTGADATLVTGDLALQIEPRRDGSGRLTWQGFYLLDLVEAWQEMTSHPVVYSLWVAGPQVDLPKLTYYFKASLRHGLTLVDSLTRESAAQLDVDLTAVRDALEGGGLKFFMRSAEVKAVEDFFRRAQAAGLIAETPALDFWEEAESEV